MQILICFNLDHLHQQTDVIYATTGESNIYAYTLDLQELWTDNIANVNTSGVAIGLNGLIAVAGSNKQKFIQ
ncbi:MAG: hypothetical protein MZV64_30655 [Ignavibacteriales bacterium]|nr:hypothetical protein [Ignavibacteriales bacterium]